MKHFSARVEYPNSPDSDTQARVFHVVEWTDGAGNRQSTTAYATSPMDAITMVRNRYEGGIKPLH
jgi:hypothetical protein